MLRLAWIAVVAGTLAPACAEPRGRPSVLLVTVDTLRADFLGCYGMPADLTPNLDRLAESGLRFERHYSPAVYTGPAHASLLSGLYPPVHGVLRNGVELGSEPPLLPEVFAAAGYRTGAVVAAAVLGSDYGFARGFETFDEPAKRDAPRDTYERTAGDVVDRALALLAADDDRPVFLWVHLYDPHYPYAAPVEVPYSGGEALAGRISIPDWVERSEADGFAAAYAAEIAYVDAELGRLLARWDELADGVVAVTADHGEGLRQRGYRPHGMLLYDEHVRAPLLLRAPSIAGATRIDAVTSAVGLPATLLSLAGLPAPDGAAARLQLEAGEGAGGEAFFCRPSASPNKGASRSKGFPRIGCGLARQVGLVEGRWKAIFSEEVGLELYDLQRDPGELTNVAEANADEARALSERLRSWAAQGTGDDEAFDDDTRRMLDALGY
ncbi:MAG: sulfatase [Planctomycetota bacterium]